MNTAAAPPLARNLLSFARLLRRLGFAITATEMGTWQAALALVDPTDRSRFKAASRAVLVSRQAEIPLFDRAFDLFFRPQPPNTPRDFGRLLARTPALARVALAGVSAEQLGTDRVESDATVVERQDRYSDTELLRHKDFAALTPQELAALRELVRSQSLDFARRRSRRWQPSRHAERPDFRRTLRLALRSGGEPLRLAMRKRRERPRPLVVLCDVSGSMAPYTRILLEFLYALLKGEGKREVFAFGTRLTRLTRPLRKSHADQALAEAAAAVMDWGGGTRTGEALRRFNIEWGRRVLGRGAVVLVVSDGLDRGDVALLSREIAHLARSAWRLLWLNPLLGVEGYQPLAQGMKAALPFLDEFLPVHNLDSLQRLADHLARLSTGTRSGGRRRQAAAPAGRRGEGNA